MAKKKLGRWIQKLRVGNATVTVHGKTKKAARANGLRFAKRHLKNFRLRANPRTKVHKHFGIGTHAEVVYAWAKVQRAKFPGRKVEVQERSNGSWDVYVFTPKIV